ncbi:MAG: acyltransferase [Candidatus Eisenbacteria bacterium]
MRTRTESDNPPHGGDGSGRAVNTAGKEDSADGSGGPVRPRRGLPALLTGVAVFAAILLFSLLCFVPFYLLALVRVLVPWRPVRRFCIQGLLAVARLWGFAVRDILRALLPTQFEVSGVRDLGRHEWFLIVANHQSWVDILVLFVALHGKVPFFRFFMKRELLWLPFFGLALWALDFPAMHRYTREHLERHPEDRGRDLETTRQACEKFRKVPVTLVNFLEGTRFRPERRDTQDVAYRHLLRPKSGGLALVLAVMGSRLSAILDVTLVYPPGAADFWKFVSGQVPWVVAHVDRLEAPARLIDDVDTEDAGYRKALRDWLHERWVAKDRRIADVISERR